MTVDVFTAVVLVRTLYYSRNLKVSCKRPSNFCDSRVEDVIMTEYAVQYLHIKFKNGEECCSCGNNARTENDM
jgi:hypothetical protein